MMVIKTKDTKELIQLFKKKIIVNKVEAFGFVIAKKYVIDTLLRKFHGIIFCPHFKGLKKLKERSDKSRVWAEVKYSVKPNDALYEIEVIDQKGVRYLLCACIYCFQRLRVHQKFDEEMMRLEEKEED